MSWSIILLHITTLSISLSSEYGDRWHKDGIFEKRQNVFDDFIAGAEYLIENKYTSAKRSRVYITYQSQHVLLLCLPQASYTRW